jgi:hypothetical protein
MTHFIYKFTNIQIILIGKSSGTCVPCDDVSITCPSCPEGTKCILTLRSCSECPKPRCVKPSPDALVNDNDDDKKNKNQGNKSLLPAVIGGIVGVGFLAAVGGSLVWKRRTQNERGIKLSGSDEMISTSSSISGENVIPIAYIPPTTPTTPNTPKPEPTYPGLRVSNNSCGTTPLASPCSLSDGQLIDITGHDDTATDVGTILQATKTASTTTTATIITATRAKPALVRLNTLKKTTNTDTSSTSSTRNENSIPGTPKTPITNNTFLYAPSISSVPSSPTSNFSLRIEDSDTEQIMPRIDIERPSAESTRVTNHNITSQNLNSPLLDPIEGRQSFGLFGSDEVYSNDPSLPQLERESIVSSSSNGRSTMSSDGDGEIMIFWGGVKEHVDSTDKGQNKETKAKESI